MLWWSLRQLKSEDWQTRQRAAEKLGRSKDWRAAEPLMDAVHDVDPDVRKAAAAALSALGWRPQNARERAKRAVAARDFGAAVAEGTEATFSLLIALYGPKDSNVRKAAATALGEIGDPGAAIALGGVA